MKSNKAPGLDGLTVEFYREFWGKVRFFLIDVLNKSYDEKLLSFSQRTSVLSLLFKKGDPLVLDNYRPISLLNVDLKLLSYVLAPQIINDSLNPKYFKVVKINVHSSESNAFLKSTKTISPSTL
jgi:hypothetical protein